MANETQVKFGHPASVVHSYGHWSVQVRPAQATLGALVMICTDPVRQFSSISPAAFGEMQTVVGHIEATTRQFRPWTKINYLMLMMVDPDVHFHVLPRYDAPQTWNGLTFEDGGWPAQPDLAGGHKLDDAGLAQLTSDLKTLWPG